MGLPEEGIVESKPSDGSPSADGDNNDILIVETNNPANKGLEQRTNDQCEGLLDVEATSPLDSYKINRMLVENVEEEHLAKIRSVTGEPKIKELPSHRETLEANPTIQPTERPERHTNIQLEPGAVSIQPWGFDSEDDEEISNDPFTQQSYHGQSDSPRLDLEQAVVSIPNQGLVVQGELGYDADERIRQDALETIIPVPAKIWEASDHKLTKYRRRLILLLIALAGTATVGISLGLRQKNTEDAYSVPAPSMVPSISMSPSQQPSAPLSLFPSFSPSESPTHFVWNSLLGPDERQLVERQGNRPIQYGAKFGNQVAVAGPLDSNSTMLVAVSYQFENTVEFFSCNAISGCQAGLWIEQNIFRNSLYGDNNVAFEGYIRIALSRDGNRLAILTHLTAENQPVSQIWLFDFSTMQIDALIKEILTSPGIESTSYPRMWEVDLDLAVLARHPSCVEFSENGEYLMVLADLLYVYQISLSTDANNTIAIQPTQTFSWDPALSAEPLPVEPGQEVLMCSAINSNMIAFGSNIKYEDSNPNNVGWDLRQPPYFQGFRVRVFATDGEQIGQTIEYPPPFSLQAPLFQPCNSLALAANGTKLAIGFFDVLPGVQLNDHDNFGVGQVDSFELVDNEWRFLNESSLVSDNESSRGFGVSVAMSEDGSILAVGDPEVSISQGSAVVGSLQVYRRLPGDTAWESWGSSISGEYPESSFASTISLSQSGDFVVAGAPYAKNNEGGFYAYQTAVSN